jgi:hypothetical protein
MDGAIPGGIGKRAKTLCNFVLPGEKIVSGNNVIYRIYPHAGKKLYPKWETEPETVDGKKGPRKSKLT